MNVKHLAGCIALILACGSACAQKTGPHWQAGGVDGVTRAMYTVTSTNGKSGDDGTIVLPQANVVYLMPLSVTTFTESQDFTLMPGGTIMVNTTGLYRVSINVDWKGQDNKDIDLRYIGIGRIPVGATLQGKLDDGLLNINGTSYDRLAVADLPGVDGPVHVRSVSDWAPGTLAAGKRISTTVWLPQAHLIDVGDVAAASLDTMTDQLLGGAVNAGLDISARVIAPSQVRVVIENRGTTAAPIKAGKLHILASSTTETRGESADAWTVEQTPSVLLYAGEQVFGIWKSKTPGDYLQTTNQTYVQIERWKQQQ